MIGTIRIHYVMPLVIAFFFPAMCVLAGEMPAPVEILEDAAARLMAVKAGRR